MTNKEILSKAISKVKGYPYGCIVFPDILQDKKYYSTIFSHDFAKAFWGECKEWLHVMDGEGICSVNIKPPKEKIESWEEYIEIDGWKYHLQQMVLETEPLKYLEKFL